MTGAVVSGFYPFHQLDLNQMTDVWADVSLTNSEL